MVIIERQNPDRFSVKYKYFVKINGKEEVEEYIYNQGKVDGPARSITFTGLEKKGIF